MFIADSRRPRGAGIWPLQHADHIKQGIDIDMRTGILACRIKERLTDIEHVGRYWYDPHTVGDVNGGMYWSNDTRPIGCWQFAFPAIIATKGAKATQGTPTQGGNGKKPQPPMLPMIDEMKEDRSFEALPPVIPKFKDGTEMWPKFPKGHVGLGMKAVNTDKQVDYFQPTDPRMICVSFAGEPEYSSLIYDLTKDNEYDPTRRVSTHDFFRICKKPTGGFLFPDRNLLAWNIYSSDVDIMRGGWVYDLSLGSQYHALGGVSQNVSGPFDVGDDADKHRLGKDADGHPINSLHINTNAYFRGPAADGLGDAPLFFETLPYPKMKGGNEKTPVHLVYDRNEFHPFILGPQPGMWKWYAETTTYTVTIKYPPPPPPPPPPVPPLVPVPVPVPTPNTQGVPQQVGGGMPFLGATGTPTPGTSNVQVDEWGVALPDTVQAQGVPDNTIGTEAERAAALTTSGYNPNPPSTAAQETVGPDGLTQSQRIDNLINSLRSTSPPVSATPQQQPINPPGPASGRQFLRDPSGNITGEEGHIHSNPEGWDPWAPQDYSQYKTNIIGPMSPGASFNTFVGTNYDYAIPGLNFRPQDLTPGSVDLRYGMNSSDAFALAMAQGSIMAPGSGFPRAPIPGVTESADPFTKANRNNPVTGHAAAIGQQGGQTGVTGKFSTPTNTGASGDPWVYNDRPGQGRTSGRYPGGTARGAIVYMPPEVDIMDRDVDFAPTGVTPSEFYVMTAPGAWFGAGSIRSSTARPKLGYRWGISAVYGGNDLLFERTDTWGVPSATFKATYDGLLKFILGDSTSYGSVAGRMASYLTTTNCFGGWVDEPLAYLAIPANTLNQYFKGFKVVTWGTTAGNANAKNIKLYFGTLTGWAGLINNDITLAPSGLNWRIEAYFFRTFAASQRGVLEMTVGAVSQTVKSVFTTLDETVDQQVRLACDAVAASDITLHGMYIEAIT